MSDHLTAQRGHDSAAEHAQAYVDLLASVLRHQRAVRFGEIVQGGNDRSTPDPRDTDRGSTTRSGATNRLSGSLRVLERRGEVLVVATVRGESAMGRKLYLPRALADDIGRWLPSEPLTFLDYVAQVLDGLFARSGRHAAMDRHSIVSTRQLRDALKADRVQGMHRAESRFGVSLSDPMTVELAVQKLAGGKEPHIFAVPGRRGCWRPSGSTRSIVGGRSTDASPAQVLEPFESEYACDTDRVIEAARRAYRRATVGITAAMVQAECHADASLAPVQSTPVARILSDLAKTKIADGKGNRLARRVQQIRKLGAIGGRAYYWVTDSSEGGVPFEDAVARFSIANVQAEWDAGDYDSQVSVIDQALAPAIAHGRVTKIVAELNTLLQRLPLHGETIGSLLSLNGGDSLRQQIRETRERALGWSRFRGSDVAERLPHATAHGNSLDALELRELFAPFSETASRMATEAAVKSNYWRLIRRLPNPQFTGRRSASRSAAHESYFDAFDARCYLANQWGGPTVRLFAMQAQAELGTLRDCRYVLVALEDPDPVIRQRVVACLAMLGDCSAIDDLVRCAQFDVNAGVREVAIHAVGLIAPSQAEAVCRQALTDSEPCVRRLGERGLALAPARWWLT